MSNTKQIKPTYSLKSLKFENFNGIKFIELKGLQDNASWVFLTGENGFGKTSLLQAVASTFNGLDGYLYELLFKNNSDTKLKLESTIHGSNEIYRLSKNDLFGNKPIGIVRFKNWACYGSSRLDTYKESSERPSIGSEVRSLFDSQSLLENIEHQLSRWYAKQKDSKFKTRFSKTKELLIDILQIEDIIIDYDTDAVFYVEKDELGNAYYSLPLTQLASGYRSLVVMIGDMILRLFNIQPDVLDPKDLEGIVLIDELDLHLHPKWQKRIPGIFSKHFPKIQFIASTHSPIPLLGAPPNSIFLTVHRTEEDGITVERLKHLEQDLPKLTPNLLLNSPIFGYADLFSSQFDQDHSIFTEDTEAERTLNDKIEKSLASSLDPDKREALRKLIGRK